MLYKKKQQTKVTITNDEKEPVAVELLAQSIVKVAKAAQDLLGSRLNERAILVLLADRTSQPMYKIKEVLEAAAGLEKAFIKPRTEPVKK